MTDEKREDAENTPEPEEIKADTSEFKQFEEKVSKLLDKFGTEIGKERKERADLLSSIDDKIEEAIRGKRENNEDDFDPYDKDKLTDLFRGVATETQKKFFEEEFAPALLRSSQINQVKGEFNLKDEEMEQVQKKAESEQLSIRGAALDLYGERKFNTKAKEISKELKAKDGVLPPAGEVDNSNLDAFGIPTSPAARAKWMRTPPKGYTQAQWTQEVAKKIQEAGRKG